MHTYSLSPSQVYVCVCVSTAKSTYHCRLPWHSPFSTETQSQDCKTCVQQMFLWDFQNSQITFIIVWKSPNPSCLFMFPAVCWTSLFGHSTGTKSQCLTQQIQVPFTVSSSLLMILLLSNSHSLRRFLLSFHLPQHTAWHHFFSLHIFSPSNLSRSHCHLTNALLNVP